MVSLGIVEITSLPSTQRHVELERVRSGLRACDEGDADDIVPVGVVEGRQTESRCSFHAAPATNVRCVTVPDRATG